ncbi:hypothetical protein J2741_000655 [Methanolinea mesophila]|nr:hypothetical protein [Methanolinea mesophila]
MSSHYVMEAEESNKSKINYILNTFDPNARS